MSRRLSTAAPVIAAPAVGIPYLDVAGQPDVVAGTLDRFGSVAAAGGVVIMRAASSFGALGDLLASAALADRRPGVPAAVREAPDDRRGPEPRERADSTTHRDP